jgi:restriction system protein
MPVPDFQTLMIPVLRDLESGDRSNGEMLQTLGARLGLSPDELSQRLPSGKQTTFSNRIAWARTHLKAAGLIQSPQRGIYRLTDRGRKVLAQNPAAIGMGFLMGFEEYVQFRRGSGESDEPAPGPVRGGDTAGEQRTPDDLLEDGYKQHRNALVAEIRERIASMTPAGFEQLVVDLLISMGYGGPQLGAGLVTGKSGDEGIDGVIKEDRLGLETIYVQAKRWQSTVGRREIQQFAGALQGQRARKGVFITNSSYSKEAELYPASIQTTVVLIDGRQLAELLIDHNVGVSTTRRYEIKRVDSDYFSAEGDASDT